MKSTEKFVLSALGCLLLANAHADSAYQWGPWMAQEDIERAILAGTDPTELTDPTAAGPAAPVLPQLVVTTDVILPRPDVPLYKDGPIKAEVIWTGIANIDLSMKAPGGGSVAYLTKNLTLAGGSVASLEVNNGGLHEPVHMERIVVGGMPPSGTYTFTVRNADDYGTKQLTSTTLTLIGTTVSSLGPTNTSAQYTDSLKNRASASHSMTLNGSGVPTYSK